MSLKLGQVPAIVITSPETAELFLKTHDIAFASRPKSISSKYISYGGKGLVFSEYGTYWRNMRKLCTLQLLVASKVEIFSPLRSEHLGEFVKSLQKRASSSEVVDLSDMVADLIENITFKMILGHSKDDRFDVKNLVREVLILIGTFNVSDYVPWVGVFDLQGLVRRMKKVSKEFDEMMELIIKEHEQSSDNDQNGQRQKDFLDIFLALMHQPIDPQDQQGPVIDKTNIKAILMTMIIAATDTSATTVEWAMSELLKYPRVMKKLQEELESAVGMNRKVEESDMENLPYLDLVVKETLRLHPVTPLLLPRECREDVTVDGYCIKKKSRIIVNAWAIGRDPKVWSDNVEVFYPERFVNNNIDIRGHDFQLIPFGSGRRGCPGIHLGLTTVKIVLAQLVHCFHWELPFGMSPDDLDMSEKFGLTMPRSKHLLENQHSTKSWKRNNRIFKRAHSFRKLWHIANRHSEIKKNLYLLTIVKIIRSSQLNAWNEENHDIIHKLKTKDKMLDTMIEEHQLSPTTQGHHKDFIHTLLSLKDQPIHPHDEHAHIINKRSIKGIVFDMIIGASETSSNVIEWAISELVRHPRVMENLQNELKNVVGINTMVDETDLTKLSYLDMVVKETLRLHPVVPLLAPHESMEDIVIEGYHIKKKSRIIINAWAIGRDPKAWSENAEMFYPERFLNSNIDFKGQDFQLIPFGSGRRSCPGIVMGLTIVKLILAQLVHCFNWELPYGMSHDELDMNEKFGLSMPRANHLLLIPTYRQLNETLVN
uniref:Cytochrome P450 71A1 n=1 Tax=Cajanus cajan TaxID=3821 RepID=A0A151RCH2_CAJCA|nr:Cytochrome P450 71A1 [Cajanus cajan]